MNVSKMKLTGEKEALQILAFLVFSIAACAAQTSDLTSFQELNEYAETSIKHVDDRVPSAVASNAEAIVIIPEMKKLGFIAGAKRGRGVLFLKGKNGDWGEPVYVNLTGASVGLQAGFSFQELYLVFKNAEVLERLTDDKGVLTLGGDAGVAFGPIGRQGSASTTTDLGIDVFSFSKNRGLFAGISIDGSTLKLDRRHNTTYYGSKEKAAQLLDREFDQIAAEVRYLFEEDDVAMTYKE